MTDITTTNPLNQPDWQDRLARSRLGATAPTVPMLLYHGENDEVIPYSIGTDLRDRYRSLGVTLQWQSYPATDHIAGTLEGTIPATAWLADLFTGRPPVTTCL